MAQGGWSYIVTNKSRGTLYIGVTSDIARRAFEHREGEIEGFTKQHGLKRLVFVERYEDILTAIQREKTMKHRPRAWKIKAIVAQNPDWDDLYAKLA
ncbi:MAG TPA: GIY-YIG nuclease family protein [Stellaceae bacterium]|jgi:putative endonuclease|nr:GIY-YIG nuclease family protein [Stellaceae bacterium]